MDKYLFLYCPKLVIFSDDDTKVLLARRRSETDYDGIFSFIGGKMEVTDKDLIEGMRREKNEEIGKVCKIKLYPTYNTLFYFIKKDGGHMVLPHYYAKYIEGEIKLDKEYSEYRWVSVNELETFEPIIPNIPEIVTKLLLLTPLMKAENFVEI